MCGGRKTYRRQQRAALALTLLQAIREHQEKRQNRAILPAGSTSTSPVMAQAPLYHGVVDRSPPADGFAPAPAELQSEDVPSHPPTYDEATSPADIPIIDEKHPSLRTAPLRVDIPAPLPPHESTSPVTRRAEVEATYQRYRSTLDNLLDSVTEYFDTQMRLNEDKPWKMRKFEAKKQRKLEKMDRKFADQLEKGGKNVDDLHRKMNKKAEKMERWTVWALERSARQEGCCGRNERANRGGCGRRQHAVLAI